MKIKTNIVFIVTLLALVGIEMALIVDMRLQEKNRICSLDSVVCEGEVEKVKPRVIVGTASWYDYVLDSGWSSEGHFVCASRDFKRQTRLKVTDLSTGKFTYCTVTDYIEHPDRIIDLSSTAFSAIKPLKYGLINPVSVEEVVSVD